MIDRLQISPGSVTSPNPMGLSDLMEAAKTWDQELSEVPIRRQDLEFGKAGIFYAGRLLKTTPSTWSRLFEKVGAPASYLAKRTTGIRGAVLAEHFDNGDLGQTSKLVFRNDELSTIASNDLTDLTHSDVLNATAEALGENAESLIVARIGRDREDEKVQLDLVSPSVAASVRVGDVVQAGIQIVHARYGNQPTQIQSFIYRLVCSNGMTRKECGSRDSLARARRLPIHHPNGRELQLKQIRRLVQQTFTGLGPQLQELRSTSDRPANVEELLLRWLQRARISPRTMMPRLLEAWRLEGSEATQYGAVNALTRVGTHSHELSRRQRRALAALGGLLAFSHVHICPRCFSVLGSDGEGVQEAV